MTRRKIVLYRIGTLLCLAGAVAVLASTGLGASTPYLRTLGFGYGDSIYNYDFTSQSRLVVGRRLGDVAPLLQQRRDRQGQEHLRAASTGSTGRR